MNSKLLSTLVILGAAAAGVMFALSSRTNAPQDGTTVAGQAGDNGSATPVTAMPEQQGLAPSRSAVMGGMDASEAGAPGENTTTTETPGTTDSGNPQPAYGVSNPNEYLDPAQQYDQSGGFQTEPGRAPVNDQASTASGGTSTQPSGNSASAGSASESLKRSAVNEGPQRAVQSAGTPVPRLQELYPDGRPMRPYAMQDYFDSSGQPVEGATPDAKTYETGRDKLKESLDALRQQ